MFRQFVGKGHGNFPHLVREESQTCSCNSLNFMTAEIHEEDLKVLQKVFFYLGQLLDALVACVSHAAFIELQ